MTISQKYKTIFVDRSQIFFFLKISNKNISLTNIKYVYLNNNTVVAEDNLLQKEYHSIVGNIIIYDTIVDNRGKGFCLDITNFLC